MKCHTDNMNGVSQMSKWRPGLQNIKILKG